ncbi:hypothetical protein HK104_004469 [Borealophlyctis nickersoniae]|nr:hypothetical protein HK104_004469 [Borealophlyctis nickersoniae]
MADKDDIVSSPSPREKTVAHRRAENEPDRPVTGEPETATEREGAGDVVTETDDALVRPTIPTVTLETASSRPTPSTHGPSNGTKRNADDALEGDAEGSGSGGSDSASNKRPKLDTFQPADLAANGDAKTPGEPREDVNGYTSPERSPLPPVPHAPLHKINFPKSVRGLETEPGEVEEEEDGEVNGDAGEESGVAEKSEGWLPSDDGSVSIPVSPFEGPRSPDPTALQTEAPRRYQGWRPLKEYNTQDMIGKGTFGQVFIATLNDGNEKYALKKILLPKEMEENQGKREEEIRDEGIPITALREIKILKTLQHKNIVELREMAWNEGDASRRERGQMYMVFPYLDHDLAGLLDNPSVKLEPQHIKSYMKQLLEGVQYLHYCHQHNILHRDIKGANILIDARGFLKLADFGLARPYNPEGGPMTNNVVTRWYRPPELCLGETFYTPAVDMWGVGAVFGEMWKRRPIMPGASDLDQIAKIFELCGSPTEESWPGHMELPALKDGSVKLAKMRRNIEKEFALAHYDPVTVKFIDRLLVLDPKKRPTAEEALADEYFFTEPAAAEPGTADFPEFVSSHELGVQEARKEEANRAPKEGTLSDGSRLVSRQMVDTEGIQEMEDTEEDMEQGMEEDTGGDMGDHTAESAQEVMAAEEAGVIRLMLVGVIGGNGILTGQRIGGMIGIMIGMDDPIAGGTQGMGGTEGVTLVIRCHRNQTLHANKAQKQNK